MPDAEPDAAASPSAAVPAAGSRPAAGPVALTPGPARGRVLGEVAIVLALSLGASAVYAVVSLVAKLTAPGSLGSATARLNSSVSPRPYLDLTYQLLGIAFALAPVVLVVWLLAAPPAGLRGSLSRLGLSLPVRARDLAWGAVLAAAIGLPGLGLYAVGRALHVTARVVPDGLQSVWWAVPVLVLAAVKNAVLEEVIVAAYLMRRLEDAGWGPRSRTAASALLRGSYHLYQGFGPFVGNAVMGVVFAEWFRRTGRTWPLIVAHTLLDVVAFVGYRLVAGPNGW
ncbi:MAG: CPBP family intramembrane glutamic endopeptidase [Kineosporiaceae bacterium]